MKPNFTAALTDCQAADALEPAIAAREEAAKLGDFLRALRALSKEQCEEIFWGGQRSQYSGVLCRTAVASGRAIGRVEALEIAAGAINPQQIGKPIAAGTSVKWQGE